MAEKIRKITEIIYKIAIYWCIGIVSFFILMLIAFFFTGSYADGTYDKCMERCVLPDKSNYDECTFSTCDFPI